MPAALRRRPCLQVMVLAVPWTLALTPTAALLLIPLASAQSPTRNGTTAPTIPALAARIDAHYNALHSLSLHFTQEYQGMGMDRRESGVLLLQKPGRMRWTYSQPSGKLFVLDGHSGYFYSPGDTEAQQVPVKKLDDLRSPLRLLLGHAKLMQELTDISLTTAADGNYTLSGIPRGLVRRIASFRLNVDRAGVIQSMRIEGTDGIVNSFTFTGQVPNPAVTSADFTFTPPAGVVIVSGMPPI
jgi:outer membrane lipoprotein carrier protein